jgi:hypothetical protein
MACRFACLLVKLVTASKTHCSTPALLDQGSRAFCISASCGHASCSRSSDTRLPHAHLHHPSSPTGSSIQNLACKMWCYGMSFCVPAVHTSPPQRPTAPPKRSSPRCRKASASARHAVTHHADGLQAQGFLAHTSITPLPYKAPASKVWHAKCSAIACRFACLLSQVTTAKAHCSTQALLAQMQKGFCVSASCCDASCRRPSGTGLPRAHLHHPSALPGSGIQRLACKM